MDALVPLRLLDDLAEGVGAESTFLVHVSKYAAAREGLFRFGRLLLRDLALEDGLLARKHLLVADTVVVSSRHRVTSD